jgi:N utilization substance protein B
MRSQAREAVFKFIFSQLFNPDDEGLFTVLCKELNQDDKSFAETLLNAVNQGKEEYLLDIEKLAVGYKLNRLYNADKCVLLIGFAEINAFPDTPKPVIINEMVNLVAKFSTENSTNFVNGVLAEYVRGKNNG